MNSAQKFTVACPGRSVCDHYAKVFASVDRLDGHYLGTRRGADGIPESHARRFPLVGLLSYAAARLVPAKAEAARVATFPLFDRWVTSKLKENCNLLSSYGYVVEGFRKVRSLGGRNFMDAGNSHPENYWEVVSEEHARWGVSADPYPRPWHERALQSLELTDWVFCPSSYVKNSFLSRGFPADRILTLPYPVNLENFSPQPVIELPKSPLRVVCTGGVSLRKGFPYLLEAMRLLKKDREVVLMLTEGIQPAMRRMLEGYRDIPVDWAPRLPHTELGARLKSAHVFALLSVEEGLARTGLEAMACGLPVVVTPNTGLSDFVKPGVNGEVVPIRDAVAAAEAIVRCHERRVHGNRWDAGDVASAFNFENFTRRLLGHLATIDESR